MHGPGRITAPASVTRPRWQWEATATDKDVIADWAGNPPQALVTWIYDWVVSMLQPSVVRVPDVSGLYVHRARHQLRQLGLRVRAADQTSALDRVRGMDPRPGTEAKRGTVVTLYCVPEEGGEYA